VITHLEGRVREADGAELGVTVNGITYAVTVPTPNYTAGEHVELWVHSITKETGTTLYGFPTREERAQFVELLGIKGVGPTTAMRILAAGADPRSLEQLVAIKGIGAKIAETIIAELGAAA
jgi:Holliday junction DNA helicase RuvA